MVSADERPIGLVRATALVVGIIIGASIFVQPSEITRLVPDARGMLAVWLVCGVLTLFGALICARLAAALPRTGGVYVFLSEAWSPALGVLWGWAMFWSMHSGIVAAIAVVVGRYVGFFVDVDERATAVGAIAAFSIINYIGVRQGSAVQTFFTVVKMMGIVVLLGIVVAELPWKPGNPFTTSSSLSWPASSPTAAGTWSPTPRARRATRSAPSPAR